MKWQFIKTLHFQQVRVASKSMLNQELETEVSYCHQVTLLLNLYLKITIIEKVKQSVPLNHLLDLVK